ncbi:DUF3280 domain-containing protein [Halomonas shantousis]
MRERTAPRQWRASWLRHTLWSACTCCLLAWGSPLLGAETPAPSPRTIVVLPFDLIDTSPLGELNHGPQAADLARLERTQQTIRQVIATRAEFTLLDNAAAKALTDNAQGRYRYLHSCNGCERDIARSLGAELVMVGWVQKVSNLILNMNAVIREADSGRDLAGASVDMRGNTDESWTRAAEYLLNRELMRSYQATQRKLQRSPQRQQPPE